MEVIRMGIGSIQSSPVPLSACIGYFDGLHLGHQQLVANAIAAAQDHHCQSALITFDPDPWAVLKDLQDIDHLTTMAERIELGAKLGIDHFGIYKRAGRVNAGSFFKSDFDSAESAHISLRL